MVKLTAQQKKNILFLGPLVVLLISTLIFYFLVVRVKPNDKILTTSEGVALFSNENPTFNVEFGDKNDPDRQWVRFEAEASATSPFVSGKKNIFTQIGEIFSPSKKSGIEMSLRGVDFSETEETSDIAYDQEVQTVADLLGTEEIKTSTVLAEMGREIGKSDDDQVISKQTIINQGVADGIDLEYQILTGLGLKEEIVINDLEAYRNSCDNGCKLPLNEFVFDLKMDEGVSLKKGWYTIEGRSTETYYFVDSRGKYVAHFLPNYAIDGSGEKTYNVNLEVSEESGGNYEVKVTVASDWLLEENRVYPIRIDPSIVHDDTSDFSGGIFNRAESVTGPKIQIRPDTDCTGGTITTDGLYKVHTFTSGTSTFSCDASIIAEILVVAGGGGGGYGRDPGNGWTSGGGGGGAGGYIYNSSYIVPAGDNTVTIGTGGAGGTASVVHGQNGTASVFGAITADGGGGGGAYTSPNGNNGGSGGGGGAAAGNTYGTGTQGNSGAVGEPFNGNYRGGGGGGAGSSGIAGVTSGNGGGGVTYSISGTSVTYSGGGGGGTYTSSAGSATGGGGAGGVENASGTTGTDNLGGGGGGAGAGTGTGGAGGSGVVIIKYILRQGEASIFGEYISPSMDMGGSMSGATLSWTASGVNTGSGETPYSTTGLVAQWDFNETSGTTADNEGSCGTTCDGTLTNFASTGSQDAANGTGWTSVNKRWGGALMFDGSNDYVSAGDQSQLEPSSVSVAAWVKIIAPQVGVYRRVAGKYNGTTNKGYHLIINGVNGGGPYFQVGNGTSSVSASSPDYSVFDGEWHHLVGTYNGTDLKIYVDGIERGTNTSSAISYGTEAFCIGGNCSTAILSSVIDSVTVYSRALSASEVLTNYQAGNIEFQYRVSADNSTWSDWTSYGTSASDLAWESFDEPYLYNTDTTGLTGYWPMEETSGSSVEDVVGSSSGTATGTTIIDGLYGKGRNFNGTSDYISMSDSDTFSFGTNNFTIDMWVYLTNTTTASHGLYVQHTDNSNRNLFYIETTAIKFYAMSGGTALANYSGTHGISANTWAHVAIVRNGTSLKIYVNGNEITLTVTTAIASNSLPNLSSAPRWGSAYFNSAWRYLGGYMDEIRLSNTALSASEIQDNYYAGLQRSDVVHFKEDSVIKSEGDGSRRITVGNGNIDKNTVALWHLDERGGSGAYIKDSSGSGLHGTPTGTVYSNSGKIGGARYYDTGTTRIDIADPAPSALNFTTTAFTVEAWVNIDGFSSARYITNCDNGSVGWGFSVNTSGLLRLTTRGTTDNETIGTTVLATGQWYHVAAVFTGTGGQRRLYINGNLEASESYTGSITTSTVAFTLGNRSTTYYRGFLDEIRISNIARTQDEIANSYRLGRDTYINKAVETRNLSSLTTLPIYVAGDRPGSYFNLTWGEEEYFNYQTDANTVALWHLNEASGTGAYLLDSSGMSKHGTPSGTTYTSSGKLGGARSFNGTSDYISTTATGVSGTANRTFEAWIKTSSTARQVVVDWGGSFVAGQRFLVYVEATTGVIYVSNNTGYVVGTKAVNDGSWHHIAVVLNGTNSTNQMIYIDGQRDAISASVSQALNTGVSQVTIGEDTMVTPSFWFNGYIDEVRISNTAKTAWEIREAYEMSLRTHAVDIEFGAYLASGNLITGSGDTSFSIDATVYGLEDLGSRLYVGEKVIVKENYDGTEYIAQGTVSAITESTGAVTVSSWDTGSTFPSAGYTVNADVFKWQREYIPIKQRTLSYEVNETNLLTFRITNGDEGRNIWIDDLRSTSGYLSDYTGEDLTFPSSGRYLQYKAIFNTWDPAVTPYISQVQLDYQAAGPTMDQVMRHGKWFNSSGVKQPFWWVDTP